MILMAECPDSRFKKRVVFLAALLLSVLSFPALGQGPAISSVPFKSQVLVVNMIHPDQSAEAGTHSDAHLAVNPFNPHQMAATAFTPDRRTGGSNAPIYLSANGGRAWEVKDKLAFN